ncbi:MAG: DUF4886 domain-containing protein [Clostridium sp.]|uniref:DUF4886 domain-containing protein n=1 Tax=Clostridium sp. TaxID=1506 RepID=UPI003D6C85EB
MGQVKILAIGNSFSQDATHYLYKLAKADGIDALVVNLYIGGCSIETHWHNIESDAKLYLYERDGKSTNQYVSIKDALAQEDWDFVITQQASSDSGIADTYYPYINQLFKYIKEKVPNAKRLLHQTWAYETGSKHDCFGRYHNNQKEMYQRLCEANTFAAGEVEAQIIPCGDVVQEARGKEPFIYEKGGKSLCRDGFHMTYVYGRYILASTWYEVLFRKNILDNTYIPETVFAPGEEVDPYALNVIKQSVHQIVGKVE